MFRTASRQTQAEIAIGSAYLNEAGSPGQTVPIARLEPWVSGGQMKTAFAWVQIEAALKRLADDPRVTLSASGRVKRHRADWPGYVVIGRQSYDRIAIEF
jgi:hypothetical protein